MGLFKKKDKYLKAFTSGKIIPITEVPDLFCCFNANLNSAKPLKLSFLQKRRIVAEEKATALANS